MKGVQARGGVYESVGCVILRCPLSQSWRETGGTTVRLQEGGDPASEDAAVI